MRNSWILLMLISIGLTTPVLAKGSDGGWQSKPDQRHPAQVQQDQRTYARHHRQDGSYGHFQRRMKNLRQELRHERRDNRRLQRRAERHFRQSARRNGYRQQYYVPVAVSPRRSQLSLLIPGIEVIIPLRW